MNQLQQAGSQQGSYAPIFTDRFFLGLVTNRNKLRSPLGAYYSKFISSNDALIDGSNTEVSNRLTLIRRPGNIAGITSFLYNGNIPDVPTTFYSFHEITGTVRVFVDTPSKIYLWTSTAFIPIFTKSASAGQTYFQGVGTTLYMTDGVDSIQWSDAGISGGVAAPGNSLSPITNTSLTSNVATITAINSFSAGMTVEVSGTTGGIYDGTYKILSATPTTFTYALTHANVGSASDTGWASAVYSFGLTAPTKAPSLTVTQTGAGAVAWQASTWFSTMGVLIDSHGSAQVLTSVNADGSNPSSQYGLSGNGAPAWNQTSGGTTTDNAITWTNRGPVGTWAASASYSGISSSGSASAPAMIYDPQSGGFYANSFGAGTFTSGTNKPNFNGILFSTYQDNQCRWICYGNAFNGQSPNLFKWRAGHTYPAIPPFSVNTIPDGILIEPSAPPASPNPYPSNVTVYVQTSGNHASSQVTPYDPWGTAAIPAGQPTIDNQLQWISLGSATWAATTQYNAWSSTNTIAFNVVQDTAGCLQVCTKSGISGASAPWLVWPGSTIAVALGRTITDTNGFIQVCTTAGNTGTSHPTWSTTIGATTADNNGGGTAVWTNNGYAYGSTTNDGTAVWTNVGLASGATWTANQSYYLPKGGFSPPSQFDPYGGADIIDPTNVEFTIVTGVSKTAPAPTWGAVGAYTTDNTVVWFNNGPFTGVGITWSVGFSYVYAFKSRSTGDAFLNSAIAPIGVGDAYGPYNPLSGLPTLLPAPTGAGDGSVSSASPAATLLSSNAGAVITVSGLGSTDPGVDTIEIYRTSDGGATYFRLTDIVAPPPIGGVAQPWVFHDAIPDVATTTSDGLDTLVIAPTNNFNATPPTGLINITQHLGRIFGSVGSTVFASNGPLVGGASQPAGNGFTAFNLGVYWSFPSPVTRLVPTAGGLFVFTTSDLYIIAGGPSIGSLFQSILVPGLGLSSYNALCVNGNIIMFETSDNQLVSLDPNMGVSEIGSSIGDKINGIDPTLSYLAYLVQGSLDKALFVADGSTGWYRCNPNLAPDSPISGPVWSPFATITGGIKAIAAIEYTPGKHALVMGATSANHPILVREFCKFATFTDNGSAYSHGLLPEALF